MTNTTLRIIAQAIKTSFSTKQPIKIPALTGSEFRQLMELIK